MTDASEKSTTAQPLSIGKRIWFCFLILLFIFVSFILIGPELLHKPDPVYIVFFLLFYVTATLLNNRIFVPQKKQKDIGSLSRTMSALSIITIMVGIIIIPKFGGQHTSSYDPDAKANLHNVFLGCKAYWADNGSKNNCTPAIASQLEYGYIQSADVNLSASGAETDFSGKAKHVDSTKTFRIDSNGTITP